MKYIVIVWVLFLSVTASDADPLNVSTILFPETKDWINVTTLPKPTEEWLKQWKWLLRQSYLAHPTRVLQESPDCSFITRALYEGNIAVHLYLVDVDSDGIQDVMYVGPAQCAEGEVTIVWHGSKTKAGIWTVAERKPTIFGVKVLRLFPAPEPKISSVVSGCCADPIDRYLVGYVYNPYRLRRLDVLKELVYPAELLPKQKRLRLEKESILRASPDELNDYNEARSKFLGHAVFGNVQRKYLPGAEALILATKPSIQGVEWAFAIIDESNDYLVYYSPYRVNVGWIRR
jgi:hypothetical protein